MTCPLPVPNSRSIITVASLGFAACGSDDGESSSSAAGAPEETAAATSPDLYGDGTEAPATSAASEAPATVAATDAAAPAASAADVMLAESDLGTILVDGAGLTLYLFTNDSPGVSACSGGCAENWPGFGVDAEPVVGEGLDAADFTTITGTDGSPQLAFHDHPLYYFAGDSAPGDTNGQNVGTVWFVIDADGNAVPA